MIAQFVGDPSFTAVLMLGTVLTFIALTIVGLFVGWQELKKEKKNENKTTCCPNHRASGNGPVSTGTDQHDQAGQQRAERT